MPKKPEPRISAWSYSRYRDHKQCPRRARYKHVDRLPDPGGPALQRGTDIHTLAEKYVRGDLDYLPSELESFEEEFAELRKLRAACADDVLLEAEWAFLEQQLEPCAWFDKRAWLRSKVDCAVLCDGGVIRIIDYKTGKVQPAELEEQLELYGFAGHSYFRGVELVQGELWFLDHGHVETRRYPIADLPKLERLWRARSAPMLADRTFPARPGQACRFCPYAKGRGGPCEN